MTGRRSAGWIVSVRRACGKLLLACATASCSLLTGAESNGAERVQWRLPIADPPASFEAPAVSGERLFVKLSPTLVGAFALADRRQLWRVALPPEGSGVDGGPSNAVVCAGVVVVGQIGRVIGLTADDGTQRWSAPLSRGGALVTGQLRCQDGVVYVGTFRPAIVYAIDASTGRERWARSMYDLPSVNAFAINPLPAGRIVVVGTREFSVPLRGFIVGLDVDSGREVWRFTWQPESPSGWGSWNPGGTCDGSLCVVSVDDGRVFAMDAATGAVRWTAPAVPGYATPADDRPIAITDSVVLVGSRSGVLTALRLGTGERLWTVGSLAQAFEYSVYREIQASGGAFLIVNSGLQLIAIDARSGDVLWRANHRSFPLGGYYPMGAVAGNTWIVTSTDGLYGLRIR